MEKNVEEQTSITSLGNAGFYVRHGSVGLVIDPWPGAAARRVAGMERVDLILITHDHWDHFNPAEVRDMAERHEAFVVGPRPVMRRLEGRLRRGAGTALDPDPAGQSAKARLGGVDVTAVRTLHGGCHNSYLVEMPGLRLFHDGDNEHTQCIDRSLLGDLDALMICPWQGSGWVGFIDALKPRYWFVMHLTDEELDQHDRGGFFPELCDRVPEGLVALRAGETKTIEPRRNT